MAPCPGCVFACSGCVVGWNWGVLNAPPDLAKVGTRVESVVSGLEGGLSWGGRCPGNGAMDKDKVG